MNGPIQGAILAAVLVGAAACASAPPRAAPAPSMPLADALQSMGATSTHEGADGLEVVLIKDRHAVGPGIFLVDEELRALHRDHKFVVSVLVARGFRLLGCELALGPIPQNQAAQDHREHIGRARANRDDLDRWAVFQPLRYEVEFAGRLQVLGVEDPALYQEDLDALSMIEKSIRARQAPEATPAFRRAAEAEEARLLARIRSHRDERGRLAARNLLDVMRERGIDRAILLLGAAHMPGASEELVEAGVRHHIFESPAFQRRGP